MKKTYSGLFILFIIIGASAIGVYFYLQNNPEGSSDTISPNWIITPSNQFNREGNLFSYDVNASDAEGIDSYWVNDTSKFSINSNGLIDSIGTLNLGSYWLEIRAYDPSNNFCTATIKVIVEGYVRVYINSTIYGSIQTEINQYKQDIGYKVSVINYSDTSAINLRGDLIASQNLTFLGAVLVGDMPYLLYDNESVGDIDPPYPCDLLLMDLDGSIGDMTPVPDGDYDMHVDGLGDIFPEIWIGRINPECLNNLGVSHIQAYKDYFKRNHDYRAGVLTRPDQALLYIDNDWSNLQLAMYNDFISSGYSTTNIYTPAVTNDTDYETNRLTNASIEWVHVMVHSFSWQQQWGWTGDGSEGITTNTEINSIVTQPLFYNLFSCSACDISFTNNIGTQYLFSNNTLAVIGSTKTGGMWMISYFYTPLGQGKTIGESFRLWWWNGLHGPSDIDSKGMILLGDPLLTK